jgi:chemotaxis protein methyltransferase CheR
VTLPLSAAVFNILSALVEERTGLHYDAASRALFAEKISGRAVERGFDSLLDYYYYLRYDPGAAAELDELVETLVVGETYFFRELDQLRAFVQHVLVPALDGRRRVRVWSAACATGEEPLTLAMLLEEKGVLDRVEITASDLSARALARAAKGVYGRRSLRGTPPPMASRWLSEVDSSIRVAEPLRAAIQWRRVNLTDVAAIRTLGWFEAMLCRNVLIYFSDATAQTVIGSLSDALLPDGALLVGVSESLLRFGTSLRCEERGGTFIYRKVA